MDDADPDATGGTRGRLPVLIFPEPAAPEVVRVLELGGSPWISAAGDLELANLDTEVAATIIDISDEGGQGLAFARSAQRRDRLGGAVLLLVRGHQLADLSSFPDLFDDFCVAPFHPAELDARINHLLARTGQQASTTHLVEYDSLVLNTETYQAAIDGQPLDLTYMEYELLRFLASRPGRVFSREVLLAQVWGYEYFGGARTVDVHVRRLRAKLGEEHARLIQTVRSVGYRFGEARW